MDNRDNRVAIAELKKDVTYMKAMQAQDSRVMMDKLNEIHDDLKETKNEVKRTNGRVTTLEQKHQDARIQERGKTARTIIKYALLAISWILAMIIGKGAVNMPW